VIIHLVWLVCGPFPDPQAAVATTKNTSKYMLYINSVRKQKKKQKKSERFLIGGNKWSHPSDSQRMRDSAAPATLINLMRRIIQKKKKRNFYCANQSN
jgi:hypothetical protein